MLLFFNNIWLMFLYTILSKREKFVKKKKIDVLWSFYHIVTIIFFYKSLKSCFFKIFFSSLYGTTEIPKCSKSKTYY